MKKEIILHIGMGKTGTTALQDFFWENRAQLEENGIFYPTYGSVANAHHLLSPYLPNNLKDKWPFKSPAEWIPELQKTNYDRILLSSELIAWASADQVTEFCRCVQESFNLKVVIYLRRQDNIIMANYNQLVKAGSQRRAIDLIWERSLDQFNYKKIIAPWSECLGKSQIIVRPYERQQFYGGDIQRDFMHHVFGVDASDKYVIPLGNSNPRLNSPAIAYKISLHKLFGNPDKVAQFNNALLSYSEDAHESGNNIFLDQPLLSPAVRYDIVHRSAAINEFIAREYRGKSDGKMFLEPMPDDTANWKSPDLSPLEARNITRHIKDTDSQLLQLFFEGVLNGLKSVDPGRRYAAAIFRTSLPPTVLAGIEGGTKRSLWQWRHRPESQKGNDTPIMIVSLHVPMVSVDRYLAEISNIPDIDIVADYRDQPHRLGNYSRNIQALRSYIGTAQQVYEDETAVCIHGNFMPLKYRSLETNLRKRYVTWLSDPVDRIANHYAFWGSSIDMENAGELRMRMLEEEWSFEKFALCSEFRNIYSKYLWGFPLKLFDFIGIAEFSESEMQRFSSMILNGAQSTVDLEVDKPPSVSWKPCDVGSELRGRIERYHSADVRLYRRALEIRNRSLKNAVKL